MALLQIIRIYGGVGTGRLQSASTSDEEDYEVTSPIETNPGATARIRDSVTSLSSLERRRVLVMFGSILVLHVVGFFIFIAFVVPAHYRGLGIGVSVLAYTLGLRHTFDADHIAAIDGATRRAISERAGSDRARPLSFGYFFSLGHSTIVVAVGIGIIVAERAVFTAVSTNNSGLEQFGGITGTIVSASFLFVIGILNLIVLNGLVKPFVSIRRGEYDKDELERQLENRGCFYRFVSRWTKAIDKEWKMYPTGVLFGLGFDTASEVVLLATTALYASRHVPWYAIVCLPILFSAGMTLLDTTDGIFMNFAYGWAYINPVRKVYYNLAITSRSVAICFIIGLIEVLGLMPSEIHSLGHDSGVWGFVYHFNVNAAGFAILGVFALFFAGAMALWRYGRTEERFGAPLRDDEAV